MGICGGVNGWRVVIILPCSFHRRCKTLMNEQDKEWMNDHGMHFGWDEEAFEINEDENE